MAYHFLNANEQVLMEGEANKTIFLGFNKGSMLILTGNMIRVCTRDGKTHQFLVVGKQKEDWKRALTNVVYSLRS